MESGHSEHHQVDKEFGKAFLAFQEKNRDFFSHCVCSLSELA